MSVLGHPADKQKNTPLIGVFFCLWYLTVGLMRFERLIEPAQAVLAQDLTTVA